MKKTIILCTLLFSFFAFSSEVRATTLPEISEEIKALSERDDSIEKTVSINRKDKEVIELYDEDLSDKKITCIGDSVTEGVGGTKDEDGNHISYTNYIAEITGAEVINLGIGGTSIGNYWDENSFILRFHEIPEDSNIIVVFGGVNDFFIGPEMGDKDTSDTYCGDTFSLFRGLKHDYPEAEVYIVLTYKNGAESWFPDHDLSAFMEIQEDYAKEFGFHVIDLFDSGFLNSRDSDISSRWVPDGIHPNDDGNKMLAERIVSEIYQSY